MRRRLDFAGGGGGGGGSGSASTSSEAGNGVNGSSSSMTINAPDTDAPAADRMGPPGPRTGRDNGSGGARSPAAGGYFYRQVAASASRLPPPPLPPAGEMANQRSRSGSVVGLSGVISSAVRPALSFSPDPQQRQDNSPPPPHSPPPPPVNIRVHSDGGGGAYDGSGRRQGRRKVGGAAAAAATIGALVLTTHRVLFLEWDGAVLGQGGGVEGLVEIPLAFILETKVKRRSTEGLAGVQVSAIYAWRLGLG